MNKNKPSKIRALLRLFSQRKATPPASPNHARPGQQLRSDDIEANINDFLDQNPEIKKKFMAGLFMCLSRKIIPDCLGELLWLGSKQ